MAQLGGIHSHPGRSLKTPRAKERTR
jgi:hypothetical protein